MQEVVRAGFQYKGEKALNLTGRAALPAWLGRWRRTTRRLGRGGSRRASMSYESFGGCV